RQDLYAFASKVVGSRGSEQLECARTERLKSWISQHELRRPPRFAFIARLRELAPKPPVPLSTRAVQAIPKHDDRSHAAVLALIEELVAIGASERKQTPARAPECCAATISGATLTR